MIFQHNSRSAEKLGFNCNIIVVLMMLLHKHIMYRTNSISILLWNCDTCVVKTHSSFRSCIKRICVRILQLCCNRYKYNDYWRQMTLLCTHTETTATKKPRRHNTLHSLCHMCLLSDCWKTADGTYQSEHYIWQN